MNLPATAFINPDGSNQAAVRELLHQTVDLLVDAMAGADQRSPLPAPPEDLSDLAGVSWRAVDEQVLLAQVRSHLHHAMNAAHPGYIGHMDSIPTTVSVMGDMIAAAVNNNLLSVEMSPLFSRLEPQVMQAIAQAFGLGPQAGGVLVSGGSLANLQALAVARNVKLNATQTGISGMAQPVFFASEVAHTSLQKAAMLLGLGTEGAIAVKTNADSQIDLTDLTQKIKQARQQGQQPFAVIATAGTTVTGSIDPIPDIATLAQTNDLWLHVDAAYGGAVIFSEQYRHQLAGIEQADSVTFNPQKWLYVAKTCASVLFKNFSQLTQHFRVAAPYMGDDETFINLGELTVQGTRHADILKLWLSLQHIGKAGYGSIIDHNYRLAERFTAHVQARPALTLASRPQMNIICFRGTPAPVSPEQWDSWNQALQRYLLKHGHTFLSLPTYRGQRWLKAVLLNPFTTEQQIDALFQQIDRFLGSSPDPRQLLASDLERSSRLQSESGRSHACE
ncbi:MAG: aminotransferase class I/II-fold pyridoxal phosphate-dependent enzyme [Cyanobacteria bacterium P01_A01_bin.105]